MKLVEIFSDSRRDALIHEAMFYIREILKFKSDTPYRERVEVPFQFASRDLAIFSVDTKTIRLGQHSVPDGKENYFYLYPHRTFTVWIDPKKIQIVDKYIKRLEKIARLFWASTESKLIRD